VDHVAFASDRKFDGYQFRRLNPAELAQIAGRAGRATRNGTFGTTGRCPPFETELAQALVSHSFEPIKVLQWRNTALDFSSVGARQASRADRPKEYGLTRAPIAEDILVLDHAARDDDIRSLAKTRAAVERLWDVCQVPDYRKISPATHAELATTLYGFLMREGTIPTDWFARQVEQADHTDGDIDTLSNRIAHIRTWTFGADPPGLAVGPRARAGGHARGRRKFAGRAACRAPRAVRRPPHQRVDAPATRERGARDRHLQERGSRGRGSRDWPSRRIHVHGRCFGRGLRSESARRRRAEGARGRNRRARNALGASGGRAVRARDRRDHQVARTTRRQARCRRGGAQAARAHPRRRASYRRAARRGAGAARSVAQVPHRESLGGAVPARRGWRHNRHRARRCVPAHRSARPSPMPPRRG